MVATIEKAIIFVAVTAALPLFVLDKELLGLRRVAWLGAFFTAMSVHLFLGPSDELGAQLDKFTVGFCSVTMVPHIIKIMKDSMWLGLMSGPPLFIVLRIMVHTTAKESEEYWRLRAFIHTVVFFMPYVNHLPSDPSDAATSLDPIIVSNEEKEGNLESTATATTRHPSKGSKKNRSNKKKK